MDRNIVSFCCLFVIILLTSQCSCYNAGNAIEGFVDSGVKEGSKVHVKPVEGYQFLEDGEVVEYLQVKVRSGNFTGDEQYVLENSNAFRVNEKGYIIVNNTEAFNHFKVIEFYGQINTEGGGLNILLMGQINTEGGGLNILLAGQSLIDL